MKRVRLSIEGVPEDRLVVGDWTYGKVAFDEMLVPDDVVPGYDRTESRIARAFEKMLQAPPRYVLLGRTLFVLEED